MVGLSFEGVFLKYFYKLMFFSLMDLIGNFDYLILGAGNIRHEMKKL